MAAVEADRTPLPDATVESIRKNAARAQGSAHDAGRHRISLGERRAAEGVRALRQRPARAKTIVPAAASRTWTSCWCGRTSKGSTSGSSISCRSATIPARWASRWRSSPGCGCERIIRYAFEYAVKHGRKQGHHRPQGQHPEDGERALPGGGPRRSRRSTPGESSPTT